MILRHLLAALLLSTATVAFPRGEATTTGSAIDLAAILPPAPTAGSPADRADRATFRQTRALVGSARWRQAIVDADESLPAILAGFSAAAGRPLSPDATPKLAALLRRMHPEVAAPVSAAKATFRRRRPFLVDRGTVCQPVAQLSHSFDYPSGHTSWGTAVALVLAELLPDRATPILTRGRDYGDSRIVCGAHNASAVAAGRLAAAAIVARLHGDADFRAALEEARLELSATTGG